MVIESDKSDMEALNDNMEMSARAAPSFSLCTRAAPLITIQDLPCQLLRSASFEC